jgi:hypothetical protein
LCADAKRRGGDIRTRTGIKIFYEHKISILSIFNIGYSSHSSDSSSFKPVGLTLLLIFLGDGMMGWKIFKCRQKQQRMNHLINMHKKPSEISTIYRSSKTNLPINKTHVSAVKTYNIL